MGREKKRKGILHCPGRAVALGRLNRPEGFPKCSTNCWLLRVPGMETEDSDCLQGRLTMALRAKEVLEKTNKQTNC